jgi:hypothetical protein
MLHCAFRSVVSDAVAATGAKTVSDRSMVAPSGWMPFAVMRNSAFAGSAPRFCGNGVEVGVATGVETGLGLALWV